MADIYGDLGMNLVNALQAGQQSGRQNRLFQRQEEEYGRGINQRAITARVAQKFKSSGSKDPNDLWGIALSEGLDVESTLKLTTAFKNMNTLDVDQQKLQLGLMNYGLALQKEKREGGLAERKQKLEEVKEFGPDYTLGGGPSAQPMPGLSQGKYSGQVPPDIQPHIDEATAVHGLDPELVKAIIATESGFNPTARSQAGAGGLMQLMPGTAKDMGLPWEQVFDPRANIGAGTKYLKSLLDQYGGDTNKALAHYYTGKPDMSPEAQQYIGKVAAQRGGGQGAPGGGGTGWQLPDIESLIKMSSNGTYISDTDAINKLRLPYKKKTDLINMVEQAATRMNLHGENIMRLQQTIFAEVDNDPTVKNFRVTKVAFEQINELSKSQNPIAHAAIVFRFVNMLDPNSAVLGAEQQEARRWQAAYNQLRSVWNKISGEGLISSDMINQVVKAGRVLYDVQLGAVKNKYNATSARLKRQKYDPETVLGKFDEFIGEQRFSAQPSISPIFDKAPGKGTVIPADRFYKQGK